MQRRWMQIVCLGAAAASLGAGGLVAQIKPSESGRALFVMTGSESEIATPRHHLAASQEVFDELWVEHMGDRVQRAAQGSPMPPRIDFDACEAILIFAGDGFNSNGFRVADVINEPDAVTVRVERISYQTASFDGPDRGDPARPWAMLLLPATDRTIILEENVQGLIGGEAIWQQRAAFPGLIGVGRPVPGTAQRPAPVGG